MLLWDTTCQRLKYMEIRTSLNRLIVLILMNLIAKASLSFAQTDDMKWKLSITYASLKPFVYNDQWFVTAEGYHIHPRTEEYTPGFSLGVERSIFKRVGLELGILYGLPPATLGVIDQFSASDREFLGTERYHFLTVIIKPNIYLLQGHFGDIYASPTLGYGILSEKTITPSFGPSVTWTKSVELIYGFSGGFNILLKNPNIYFSTEFLLLSMKTKLEEPQTGRELKKKFGPFGILLGIAYKLD